MRKRTCVVKKLTEFVTVWLLLWEKEDGSAHVVTYLDRFIYLYTGVEGSDVSCICLGLTSL